MRIVFFGTPRFAAYNLEKIVENGFQVVAVVTAPDKPSGRGMRIQESEVKKVAIKHGIKILQPLNMKHPDFVSELQEMKADVQVVIAFRMMPEVIWAMPRLGTFNLHASLLPAYRGAAPINHVLINGEKETGVTTFFLKQEIDTGDIAFQEKVSIEDLDDYGTLHDKLMEKGAELVIKTLKGLKEQTLKTKPQKADISTPYAHKINKEFCEITLDNTAIHVHQKVKGLSPYPGAWVIIEGVTYKIWKTQLTDFIEKPSMKQENGWYIFQKRLFVKCKDSFLEVLSLQPENRPRVSALDFINGLASKKI